MGWGGANDIVLRVASVAEEFVFNREISASRELLTELVKACRDHDADNLYELEGEFWLLDEVLKEEGILGDPD